MDNVLDRVGVDDIVDDSVELSVFDLVGVDDKVDDMVDDSVLE